MKYLFFLFVIFISVKCTYVPRKECIDRYVGTFKIDTAGMYYKLKDFIMARKWDTVTLVSYPNGKYEFNSRDSLLKASEGKWSISPDSEDLELGCVLTIKQNNFRNSVNSYWFSILLVFDGENNYSVPFKKRLSAPVGIGQ